MRRGSRGLRSVRGFTYMGLLAVIVLIGLMLSAAGAVTRVALQREREAELLWVGHQYREAIGRYATFYHRYPATLLELVGETEANASGTGAADAAPTQVATAGMPPFRAMRRLYRDPMTNSADWTLVPAADGRIMGVASASTRETLKRAGFDDDDYDFDKATTYAGWLFVYQPAAQRARRPAAASH